MHIAKRFIDDVNSKQFLFIEEQMLYPYNQTVAIISHTTNISLIYNIFNALKNKEKLEFVEYKPANDEILNSYIINMKPYDPETTPIPILFDSPNKYLDIAYIIKHKLQSNFSNSMSKINIPEYNTIIVDILDTLHETNHRLRQEILEELEWESKKQDKPYLQIFVDIYI